MAVNATGGKGKEVKYLTRDCYGTQVDNHNCALKDHGCLSTASCAQIPDVWYTGHASGPGACLSLSQFIYSLMMAVTLQSLYEVKLIYPVKSCQLGHACWLLWEGSQARESESCTVQFSAPQTETGWASGSAGSMLAAKPDYLSQCLQHTKAEGNRRLPQVPSDFQ